MSYCLYHNGLLVFLIPQFPFSASLSASLLVFPSLFPQFYFKNSKILLLSSVSPAPISSVSLSFCLFVLFTLHPSFCLPSPSGPALSVAKWLHRLPSGRRLEGLQIVTIYNLICCTCRKITNILQPIRISLSYRTQCDVLYCEGFFLSVCRG